MNRPRSIPAVPNKTRPNGRLHQPVIRIDSRGHLIGIKQATPPSTGRALNEPRNNTEVLRAQLAARTTMIEPPKPSRQQNRRLAILERKATRTAALLQAKLDGLNRPKRESTPRTSRVTRCRKREQQ